MHAACGVAQGTARDFLTLNSSQISCKIFRMQEKMNALSQFSDYFFAMAN